MSPYGVLITLPRRVSEIRARLHPELQTTCYLIEGKRRRADAGDSLTLNSRITPMMTEPEGAEVYW